MWVSGVQSGGLVRGIGMFRVCVRCPGERSVRVMTFVRTDPNGEQKIKPKLMGSYRVSTEVNGSKKKLTQINGQLCCVHSSERFQKVNPIIGQL